MGLFSRIMGETIAEDVHNTTNIVEGNTANAEARRVSALEHHLNRANVEAELREKAERKAKELQQANDTLTREQQHLHKIAVEIAVDRRAILNALDHLQKKWGKPNVADEVQAQRLAERAKLEGDPNYVTDVASQVSQAAKARVKRS